MVEAAAPANEAEVETKILLHIFRLLGYTDIDRADKPPIEMYFGHEKRTKHPDFVLYQGAERSLSAALITVEAKATTESLSDAETQAQSYASWAGTPFYVVCNGKELRAVQFLPGVPRGRSITVPIPNLTAHWAEVAGFLDRSEAILSKERLSYLSTYLPEVERLPPREFFGQYLSRLSVRFRVSSTSPILALQPPSVAGDTLPPIPVSVKEDLASGGEVLGVQDMAGLLSAMPLRVLVVGDAGSGKSTFCGRIATALASQDEGSPAVIPVYVPLRRLVPSSVWEAFKSASEDMGVRVFEGLSQTPLSRARVICILDGLDEIDSSYNYIPRIAGLLRENAFYSLVIASRPLAVDSEHHGLPFDSFRRVDIQALSMDQIRNVFTRYLDDDNAAGHLLAAVPAEMREQLRLPLFTLLVLRVAQTNPNWSTLSNFKLYKTFVTQLHSYYSDPAVRGTLSSEEELLHAIASAAEVQFASTDPISLGALALEMSNRHLDSPFRALLNAGIISGSGGYARFVHQTFFEFGIAIAILRAIHVNNSQRLIAIGPTPGVYEFVRSEIGTVERRQLIEWLASAKSKLQRRIINLLKEDSSTEVVDAMLSLYEGAASLEVWAAAATLLLARGDRRVLRQLPTVFLTDPARARRFTLAVVRVSADHIVPDLVRCASETRSPPVIEVASAVVVGLRRSEFVQECAALYRGMNVEARRSLSTHLAKTRVGAHGRVVLARLVSQFLENESDPTVVLKLLALVRPDLIRLSSTAVEKAAAVLNEAETFTEWEIGLANRTLSAALRVRPPHGRVGPLVDSLRGMGTKS